MTVRTDVSIDWESSPRVITVAAPSTEMKIQDLHDTLVSFEDSIEGGQHDNLVSSVGKTQLDAAATKFTGITLTMLNTQISFEARSGPDWVECDVIDGNLAAVDTDGVTFINPKYNRAFVNLNYQADTSVSFVEQGSGLSGQQDTKLTQINNQLMAVEGSMNHNHMLRMLWAVICGKARDADTDGNITADTTKIAYMSLDGTTERIVFDVVDFYGTRTGVAIDPD